ncbi:MAG: pentapeptide repeat-containing protein [Cyanobacteria bacterium P01_D01_bin.2]
MKARELLKRYRLGERDFRGVDLSGESLRGMNLTGIDLSGADLSKTDLRGTNFTQAQLVRTEFAYARTGTRRRWIVPIVLVALLLLGLASVLLGLMFAMVLASLIATTDDPFGAGSDVSNIIGGAVGLVTLAISTFIYYHQGIWAMLGAVAAAVAVAVAGAGAAALISTAALAGAGTTALAFSVAFAGAVTFAFAVAFAGIFTFVVAFAGAVVGAVVGAVAFTVASTFAFIFAFANSFTGELPNTILIGILSSLTALLFTGINFTVARRALTGDPRDRLVRDLAVNLISLGGSSFRYANLTDAKFLHTVLKGAHFQSATLQCTCFHLSKKLHLSRADKLTG